MADADSAQGERDPPKQATQTTQPTRAMPDVIDQSNLELVRFFLEFRRQHNWFWPCTCYPEDKTFDAVSLRVYAVDMVHALARLVFMVILAVHYLGDLEEHNIQPIINKDGLLRAPSLQGHQWAQQLYADTSTWLNQPIRSTLFQWMLMELVVLWLKHMGNFLMLRRLKLRLNELQLTGTLSGQVEHKEDKSDQNDQIDGPPSFAAKYLQHMENRVDLPAGNSLHNTPDGQTVQNIFSVTKELLEGQTREEVLEGESMAKNRKAVADDTDGLTSKLLLMLLLYVICFVLILFVCGWFGNLHLLVASTNDDSAAQMTAVSLLLAAFLPLWSMDSSCGSWQRLSSTFVAAWPK